MVATGSMGGRHLYTTIKSVFMHRSTPLHFHFITDGRAKTILQAMLDTWLLPRVSHDYYDLHQALETIRLADSLIHCSQVISIYLNLHLILPDSVRHVIAIEPTSVVNVDLAQLYSLTESRENHMISVCGAVCVSYCSEDSVDLGLSRWGAVGINLDALMEKTEMIQALRRHHCLSSAADTVDKAVMELAGRDPAPMIEDACETVRNYDGGLLRHREMAKCPEGMEPLVVPIPSSYNVCEVCAWERVVQRREVPFILGHSYTPRDEYDVTMATHLDYNRLDLMGKILTHWDGPASVGIHVTDSEVQRVLDFLGNSTALRERDNVTYHLVFRLGPSYPPNHMREIGHRYVATPYTFFLDVDFMPSPELYQNLREKLMTREFGDISKTAVVIAAFETDDETFRIPSDKPVLIELLLKKKVHPFHLRIYAPGHKPTDYLKWMFSNKPYYARWDNYYEPYYVMNTSVVSFDHRFVARFLNKCSHALELHMAGYKFLVSPSIFVIHLPHSKNKQNMSVLRHCNNDWYADWIKEKRKQYNYTGSDVRDYMVKPVSHA